MNNKLVLSFIIALGFVGSHLTAVHAAEPEAKAQGQTQNQSQGQNQGQSQTVSGPASLKIPTLNGKQAFLGEFTVTINWEGNNIKKDTVKVMINGKELPAGAKTEEGTTVKGSIQADNTILNRGPNSMKLEAFGLKDEKVEKEGFFYYYPDNRVKVGDQFELYLGAKGSAKAEVDGEVLRLVPNEQRPDNEEWARIEAAKAGNASIRIVGKNGEELKKYSFTVVDSK